ncbi:DNA cytosine methyltransferase, partial [Acinetobacter baumannii]
PYLINPKHYSEKIDVNSTHEFLSKDSFEADFFAPYITEFANASQQRNWSIDQPLSTICAQVKGGHHGLVTAKLSKNNYEGAMRVAAFIINYY